MSLAHKLMNYFFPSNEAPTARPELNVCVAPHLPHSLRVARLLTLFRFTYRA